MNNYITIFVNGQPFNCKCSMSLKDLLLYLNFDLNLIIVEYNKDVINQFDYDKLLLSMNDYIEVITVVGGG